MIAEPAPLPGDDRARLNEDQNIAPARPQLGQPGPEEAIDDLGVGTRAAPLVDGELVTQGEHLKLEGGPRPEASAEQSYEGEQDGLHGGRRLPHLSGADRESLAQAHGTRNLRDPSRFDIIGTDTRRTPLPRVPVPAVLHRDHLAVFERGDDQEPVRAGGHTSMSPRPR